MFDPLYTLALYMHANVCIKSLLILLKLSTFNSDLQSSTVCMGDFYLYHKIVKHLHFTSTPIRIICVHSLTLKGSFNLLKKSPCAHPKSQLNTCTCRHDL